MTFDVNDPAHLLTLKTEVATDPIGMDYSGNTTLLLKQLSDADKNVGGEVAGATLTVGLLFDAIALSPADLNLQGQFGEGAHLFIGNLLQRELEIDIQKYRAAVEGALSNGAVLTELEGQTMPLSRAEVLFGQGTSLSKPDWYAARDS